MQAPRTHTPSDLGLLLLRSMVGVVFVFHGSQKLFGWFGGYGLEATGQFMESLGLPAGTLMALAAGSTELLGGLALISGVGARLAALPLAFTMLVASFTAHSGFSAADGGMEYSLTLAVTSIALGLLGPGRFVLRPAPALGRAVPQS